MSVRKDQQRNTWLYEGSYRDAAGEVQRYKKRGFATKKEAKEAEHAFLAKARTSRPSITLDELVKRYHEDLPALGIKESTLVSNESYYKKHIKDSLGKLKLSKITVPVLQSWMTDMSTKLLDGKPYAAETVNKARSVVSKYLVYAVRLGYIDSNPCRDIPRVKRPTDVAKKAPNFWEVDTFQYFISCVDDLYWRDVFTFLFGTGLREGEMFALQWSDVNLGTGKLSVSKTCTVKNLSHKWKLTTPKTRNSIRVIDLQDALLEILRRRYSEAMKLDGFSMDYFIFGDAQPLSKTRLATHLDAYIKKAGVPRITPHGFRHSHASYLIKSGKIDDQLIADRLGHTVTEMRKTYAHIYEESRRDLKDVLNDLF